MCLCEKLRSSAGTKDYIKGVEEHQPKNFYCKTQIQKTPKRAIVLPFLNLLYFLSQNRDLEQHHKII